MKLMKATILFAVLVPALSQAQTSTSTNDATQSGTSGAQQNQMGRTQGNSECVGPHSFCNIFAGS
ncbi:hypothetical protein LMG27952_02857 [Paraburkholderia hiiakae]|uniref:Uncharacterized protein n=1 Tax=Paraburkholderia hiiakae TaxID=1081782 RepID=A0ABM8NMX4_9BURK|nr:hypothetical protein [Paraburkholderia hiiakae]CAD6533963.1 hypothetical protein LMG27952_02857 [Paraburkholderia hiiakae]